MREQPLIGPVPAPDLPVMSFNIRRAREGPLHARRDRWSSRAPAVHALLSSERPALLALQEALPRVLPLVQDALGAEYRRVGHGRGHDGTGEGNPLFYDAERLELREQGQEALSDRPHQPGSRSWGNVIPRILVWAQFTDRSTGAAFLAVSTHLDHLSGRSRVRSAERIRDFIGRRGIPAVVMGDLNAGAGSAAVSALLAGGRLIDAWQIAEHHATPPWGTYPHYRQPRVGGRRLDWIVVSPGVRVRAAAVNARRFEGRWPSDHLAVQSILRFGEEPV